MLDELKWSLKRNNLLIGTLMMIDDNFPWYICSFSPTTNFQKVRAIFEEQKSKSDELFADSDKLEQLSQEEIYLQLHKIHNAVFDCGFYLEPVNKNSSIESTEKGILLYIDDDKARFRFSSSSSVIYKEPETLFSRIINKFLVKNK